MAEPEEKKTLFDPLQDVITFLSNVYTSGTMPLGAIGLVIVINAIYFRFPSGYGLYGIVPVIGLAILYFYRFWEEPERKKNKRYGAIIAIVVSIDLIVSVSYLWDLPIRGPALITAILDIVAIISYVAWYKDWKPSIPFVTRRQENEEEMIESQPR